MALNMKIKNLSCGLMAIVLSQMCGGAVADQAPNPRSVTGSSVVRDARRTDSADTLVDDLSAKVSRMAATNASRRAGAMPVRSDSMSTSARSVVRGTTRQTVSKTNARSAVVASKRSGTRVDVSGMVSRSATPQRGAKRAKATSISGLTASRAAVARATAVFDDVSKIGGGYATCRDAYSTCMDQFCAKANDTYRRCYCSARFTDFSDTMDRLDEAMSMLSSFEDNYLNAVNKTAEEVTAMYSATVGEAAITNDTSAAARLLDEISDLLSGKKKTTKSVAKNNTTSLGIMSLDFTEDVDDIWSGGGSNLFANNNVTSLVDLEGQALYDEASKQCLSVVKESCSNDAVLSMASSAYGILITQDCNIYEKNLNSKREQVQQAVRQAENYLRDARLEDYRAHNSADVNECLDKVRTAILADTACGANYVRCLDYSGAYINAATGEPLYTPRLFELTDMITLAGVLDSNSSAGDVLTQNPNFDNFLESKKMFVTSALDTCRTIADTVWYEFKRTALIEIAQAQDAKIEEVKMSCISTMAECYDTQNEALKSFDEATAEVTGALTARTARTMCKDKVMACASLYGDTEGCKFNGNGKLTKGNDTTGKSCGLKGLLALVDAVDEVRIASGCETAVENYVKELCTPSKGSEGYPWNCRFMPFQNTGGDDNIDVQTVEGAIKGFALRNCKDPTKNNFKYSDLEIETRRKIENSIGDLKEELEYQLEEKCQELDGVWVSSEDNIYAADETESVAFYTQVFGKKDNTVQTLGKCMQNSAKVLCNEYNIQSESSEVYATYNETTGECVLSEQWYELHCGFLGNGYYSDGVCYVLPD